MNTRAPNEAATVVALDRSQWLKRCPEFGDFSYCHSWDYGLAMAELRGARSEYVAIERGGELMGLANLRVKRIPCLKTGVAYVSRGPLFLKEGRDNDEAVRCVLAALKRFANDRGLVLRLLPPVSCNGQDTMAGVLSTLGFSETPFGIRHRTILVDITPNLQVIRARLAQKWRNCLNNAERQGLSLETTADDRSFDEFATLFSSFHKRKGFRVELGPDFYAALQHCLPDNERFVVTLARLSGKVVAGHVASLLGNTCIYLLGASSPEGLQAKAGYLLQWNAILTAKARGLLWYDLGGIDAVHNPDVYRFKAGMGGIEVDSVGPVDARPNGITPRLLMGLERMYHHWRVHRGRAV